MQQAKNKLALNIWQAKSILKFAYLTPEVIIKPKDLLFLVSATDEVSVFKTEEGVRVHIPTSEVPSRLIRMF